MSEADDTRRFEELAAAYALGALGDEERREFEAQLADRPDLQAEVEELVAAADLLSLAPQEHEPSPELRRDLLMSIGATPEEHPEDGGIPRLRRPALGRWLGPGGLAAAAALAAVVSLLVWAISLQNTNEDLRTEVAEQRREAEVLQAQANGSESYELEGSGLAADARGEVMMAGDGRAVLVAEGLPPAPEGKVYEAWVLRDGMPEPAGTFEPREGGSAAATVEGSVEGAEAVAVTVEPAGGSPMPTGDPVLTASLA